MQQSAECYTTRNDNSRHERVNSSRLLKFILNFQSICSLCRGELPDRQKILDLPATSNLFIQLHLEPPLLGLS